MEVKQLLIRGFDYDRWANRQWVSLIGGFKNMQRAQEILDHIFSAQLIWLDRCGVEVTFARENFALAELYDLSSQAWMEFMRGADPEELITYENLSGREFTQPLHEIAFHVINHGTYHRGQLRGLAEADGFKNFPETDLLVYIREHGD